MCILLCKLPIVNEQTPILLLFAISVVDLVEFLLHFFIFFILGFNESAMRIVRHFGFDRRSVIESNLCSGKFLLQLNTNLSVRLSDMTVVEQY